MRRCLAGKGLRGQVKNFQIVPCVRRRADSQRIAARVAAKGTGPGTSSDTWRGGPNVKRWPYWSVVNVKSTQRPPISRVMPIAADVVRKGRARAPVTAFPVAARRRGPALRDGAEDASMLPGHPRTMRGLARA